MSYPHRHRTTSQWTFPLQGAIRTYPVPLERRDRLGPSSGTTLRSPRPLRTVRDGFPITRLKPFERLFQGDAACCLRDTHLESANVTVNGLPVDGVPLRRFA
jgi:hypothetical protein